jgi:2-oxoglutarate dehydrogenase E1 component
MGETLAYATLLNDGYGVRLSGEDIGRGTFSHRHSVLHDQNRERWDTGEYVPLQHIKEHQPSCEIIDSVLTEQAVVGFEYGYSTSDPTRLVVWEAQFGDFVNGAQVVIDQFISAAGEMGSICGLVIAAARLRRAGSSIVARRAVLQNCALSQHAVCADTAQVFMLRRQMIRRYRKPLIVISPKSLLRHKEAVSALDELAHGGFRTVIGETEKLTARSVHRVIACSGKVYYELLAYRRDSKIDDIAIIRLEQQYPFPKEFATEIARFPNAKEVVWVQEEPQNQGAWYRLRAYLRADILAKQVLAYAGRAISASPAVGYATKHNAEQKQLIEDAFAAELKSGEMVVAH